MSDWTSEAVGGDRSEWGAASRICLSYTSCMLMLQLRAGDGGVQRQDQGRGRQLSDQVKERRKKEQRALRIAARSTAAPGSWGRAGRLRRG